MPKEFTLSVRNAPEEKIYAHERAYGPGAFQVTAVYNGVRVLQVFCFPPDIDIAIALALSSLRDLAAGIDQAEANWEAMSPQERDGLASAR